MSTNRSNSGDFSQFLDELRTRVSISEIVGRRVTYDRHKSNPRRKDYWGCCPFHGEKTPSFHVVEGEGFYHCFGCGAHGDVIKFVMEMENLEFIGAVQQLAEGAGLSLPERSPQARQQEEKRKTLYDVMDLACTYYQQALSSPEGKAAREYLNGRGLTSNAFARFRLGYASGEGDILYRYLRSNNVSDEQIDEAGLSLKSDYNDKVQDRFRDRIIFPITDLRGRVTAFGGRAMSDAARAKYLNSPETPIFHKGRTLYNLASAKSAANNLARDGGPVTSSLVIAEGYMDVIALELAGIGQSVAPLGTALTEDQIALAWKVTPEPVLCFDGDIAGLKAAHRAIDRAMPLLKPGHSLRFALLPEGLDPDDVIRTQGPQAMYALIEKAVPMIDLLWQRETEGKVLATPEQRAQLLMSVEQAAGEIADNRVRSFYQSALKDRVYAYFNMGRSQKGQFSAFQRKPFGSKQAKAPASSALKKTALARLNTISTGGKTSDTAATRELLIVLTVVNHPGLLDQNDETFAEVRLERHELDKLRSEILEHAASGNALDKDSLRAHLEERGCAPSLEMLDRHLGSRSERFLKDDAELHEVETGWFHILALHDNFHHLKAEAKEAEAAFYQDKSEENYRRLEVILNQLGRATVAEWGEAEI